MNLSLDSQRERLERKIENFTHNEKGHLIYFLKNYKLSQSMTSVKTWYSIRKQSTSKLHIPFSGRKFFIFLLCNFLLMPGLRSILLQSYINVSSSVHPWLLVFCSLICFNRKLKITVLRALHIPKRESLLWK